LGNFQAGLPEYEWRWQAHGVTPPKFGNQQYWDGSSLEGKTILLICEQGLGDTFQFIRYAKILYQQGIHIVVHAQESAKIILGKCCDYIDCVVTTSDPLPHFDYQVTLASLPLMFNTQIETIPADIPYIKADPALVAYWKDKVCPRSFNIGICWQGNAHYSNKAAQLVVAKKSMALKTFAPISEVNSCTMFSLQKIDGTDQLNTFSNVPIVDFGKEVDEEHGKFMDTAAIIMNLDLIITIDTSTAHLAAALGKPTWILLPYTADWRWMLKSDTSPWYPNVRLFRQKTAGDWQGVMNKVVQALKEYIKTSKQ